MSNIDYEVRYGPLGVLLSDVQAVTLNGGRQWIVDPYNASVMQIVCRNIAGWITPPTMKQEVALLADGADIWHGTITDVDINYGIIPAMDEAVITCEGPIGLLGRRNIRSLALAQDYTDVQFSDISTAAGMGSGSSGAYSIAGAQTFTGNALDGVNALIATEVGRLRESPNSLVVSFIARNTYEVGAYDDIVFGTSGTASVIYDGITFRSSAENYYTRVTVSPLGLAAQVENSGAAPYYSLEVSTWDYSTGQADSLAQYLLAQFSATTSGPTSITAQYVAQPSTGSSRARFEDAIGGGMVAKTVTISFRGTTYYAVVEGYEITITPDNTRVVWHLSPQDVNNYLTLNDAVYGRLDYNKLGF